jgi:TatD DNase family protein
LPSKPKDSNEVGWNEGLKQLNFLVLLCGIDQYSQSVLRRVPMLPWMDAHCHLTKRFHPEPLPRVLQSLHDAGCQGFVLGGVDPLDWQEQLAIPPSPLRMARGFGLHPWAVQERSNAQLDLDFHELECMLPQAEALGECGLDYFRCKTAMDRQKQSFWFEKQLELAEKHRKPCILHIVRAHHEALRLIKPYAGRLRGMVHSFWANPQTAQAWLDLGFQLSLHPRILQRDNHGLLAYIPADRILFESDSPEVFKDGTVSDPGLALDIMKHIAWSQSIPLDTVLGLFPSLDGSK